MKNAVFFMDHESMQEKATRTLETLRTTYLAMQGYFLEDQNPQFHHDQHLKTNS
jgi:hypothetical protein